MATVIHRHRLSRGSLDDRHFRKFVDPPEEPGRTLDRVAPNVTWRAQLAENHDLPLPFRLPNGDRKLRMWAIREPGKPTRFPAALLRARAGQVVHARIAGASKGEHTIHWHGIEPSPMNDGVGKHSFEIKDVYTYQFQPRDPGFFFYHCHVNTPLHFEMGLFGALIVDPERGQGWVAAHNPPDHVVRYDVEAVWVITAHDSRWHLLGNSHGQMHDDDPNDPASFTSTGILNDWRPDVFTISGAVARGTTPITDPRAAVSARVGQTVLLRVLNAAYAIADISIGAPATVIAQDGRPYGGTPATRSRCRWRRASHSSSTPRSATTSSCARPPPRPSR
jgi:FtsP/CotA-like multicopper oxidase with cupredoxin domain